jgi:hypothetical protein
MWEKEISLSAIEHLATMQIVRPQFFDQGKYEEQ